MKQQQYQISSIFFLTWRKTWWRTRWSPWRCAWWRTRR